MSTSAQIKQIHTLKNILGMEDDLYREMLSEYGVSSSKNLNVKDANTFIAVLNKQAKSQQKKPLKKYDDFIGRDKIMATPLQLRKLEVTWSEIIDNKNKEELKISLRKYIRKQFHIDDIRFMTKNKASKIIAIFEQIKVKKYLKAL